MKLCFLLVTNIEYPNLVLTEPVGAPFKCCWRWTWETRAMTANPSSGNFNGILYLYQFYIFTKQTSPLALASECCCARAASTSSISHIKSSSSSSSTVLSNSLPFPSSRSSFDIGAIVDNSTGGLTLWAEHRLDIRKWIWFKIFGVSWFWVNCSSKAVRSASSDSQNHMGGSRG